MKNVAGLVSRWSSYRRNYQKANCCASELLDALQTQVKAQGRKDEDRFVAGFLRLPSLGLFDRSG